MYQSSLLFLDVSVPTTGLVNVWTCTYTFRLSSRMICQVALNVCIVQLFERNVHRTVVDARESRCATAV
jgi:hypothetical protein